MRRFNELPHLVATSIGVQRATKMLDRAPINMEPSPYKPAEIQTQPLGFDVNRSLEAANERNESSALPDSAQNSTHNAIADIRRWQQSRIRNKTVIDTAQHLVGYSSRLNSNASYLNQETDAMRLERAAKEEKARIEAYDNLRELQKISQERDHMGYASVFQEKKGISMEDLRNFPARVMEAEEKAFEEERKRELAVAFGTPKENSIKSFATQKVGNLTVVNLNDAEAGAPSTQPRDYVPLHPTRLLIKQLSAHVPRSKPYVEEQQRQNERGEELVTDKLFYRAPSTGGELISAPTPPKSHIVQQHKLSRGAELVAADLRSVGDEAETVKRIQEADDILLASHRYYSSQEAAASSTSTLGVSAGSVTFRHPLAVNLNRPGSQEEHNSSESVKNPIQSAIEGDDAALNQKVEGLSNEKAISEMTPLEYQRYIDVLETQRQADIADAFAKAKAFQADSEKKLKASRMAQNNQALHRKFAYADDAALKAQHAYLEKLLQKDVGSGSSINSATSNGVQWIGTTPGMMRKRFHSFIIRVLGSSVLMGLVLYFNPSLLDPPRENLYVDLISAKKSDVLLSQR